MMTTRRMMIAVLGALLLVVPGRATTVTGTVYDSGGAAVSGAAISFRLINIGRGNVARQSGTSIVAPTLEAATSAADGTFTVTLVGNDAITPAGTLYEVVIRGPGFTYGPFDYSITGASADLNSLTPEATYPNTASQVATSQLAPPSGCASGQALEWTGTAWTCATPATGPSVYSPNQGDVYVVDTTTGGSCGSLSNCYEASEARVTADGATTSGNPTVTSATINFTAADVGKKIFAINRVTGAADQRGTILSVTNSTTAVSDTNSVATATGLTLTVGTDAAPNFHAAYNTAISLNQGISIPCGVFLLDSNAPVFNKGSGNISENYAVSGCGPGGNSNSTTFVLGPDLLDTSGDLVASIPLDSTGTNFPLWNHGSSYSVSNLQITGLSYKAANATTYYVIDVPRAWNVRVFDTNSTVGCFDVADRGTFPGENSYRNLNLQTNSGSLQTSTCGGVSFSGGEGDQVLSDSIIAFISGIAVSCSTGMVTLKDDYITNVGGVSANAINTNASTVNIFGGYYLPNSGTISMFSMSSTGRFNLIGTTVDDRSFNTFVFNPNGGSMYVQNSVFKNVVASKFFDSGSISTSRFYNLGGNTFPVIPTTNIPIYLSTSTEAGTGTCAANAATITFGQTYLAAPVVTISPTTSASTGDQITATSTTTATVHCNGATDGFTYTVTPNPF